MNAINERIEWLEKALATLKNYRATHKNIPHDLLLNIIINCAEYQAELDELKGVKNNDTKRNA